MSRLPVAEELGTAWLGAGSLTHGHSENLSQGSSCLETTGAGSLVGSLMWPLPGFGSLLAMGWRTPSFPPRVGSKQGSSPRGCRRLPLRQRGRPRWKPEYFCTLISEVTSMCAIGQEGGDHGSSYSDSRGQKKNYCCYILFVRDNKLLGQVTRSSLHQRKMIGTRARMSELWVTGRCIVQGPPEKPNQ